MKYQIPPIAVHNYCRPTRLLFNTTTRTVLSRQRWHILPTLTNPTHADLIWNESVTIYENGLSLWPAIRYCQSLLDIYNITL